MFSSACKYAIRAVLYITIKSIDGSRLSIKEIAKEIDSPEPFTAKILQSLSRAGVVSSIKGPNGGFYLDNMARPIPINTIVNAIDGDDFFHSCALGLKECSDKHPCPVHDEIKAFKTRLLNVMKERTAQQLAKELAEGKTFLRNPGGG